MARREHPTSFLGNNLLPDLVGVAWSEALVAEAHSLAGFVYDWNGAAAAAGWSRGVDDEGVPCFVNERGVHEYCHDADWRDLCSTKMIPSERMDNYTGYHAVSNALAAYLMEQGENVVHIGESENVWFQTDDHDLINHPLLEAAETALQDEASRHPRM